VRGVKEINFEVEGLAAPFAAKGEDEEGHHEYAGEDFDGV